VLKTIAHAARFCAPAPGRANSPSSSPCVSPSLPGPLAPKKIVANNLQMGIPSQAYVNLVGRRRYLAAILSGDPNRGNVALSIA
jgi:hypothetical protein